MAFMADQLYPPVKENDWTGVDEYSSFNYWREPVIAIDFAALCDEKGSPFKEETQNATTSVGTKSNVTDTASVVPAANGIGDKTAALLSTISEN